MLTPGINSFIDHTLLRADASRSEILRLCQEAREHSFFSVCIPPFFVSLAKEQLHSFGVAVGTVIGFPLGSQCTSTKCFEAEQAQKDGADELDMVINISALKDKNLAFVIDDIKAVVHAAPNCLVKVIIESCLLDDQQKIEACHAIQTAGAHFVKTSTGFSTGGATTEDVQLLRKTVGADFGVKASGGIRDYKTAKAMLMAGANRIGSSQSVQIMMEEGAQ